MSVGGKDLLLHVLRQEDVRAMESFPSHLSSLMIVLSAEFKSNQVSTVIRNDLVFTQIDCVG